MHGERSTQTSKTTLSENRNRSNISAMTTEGEAVGRFPHKIQLFQAFTENNHKRQNEFCNCFSEALDNEDLSIDDVIFSDKYYTYNNVMMNKHIYRFWGI